MLEDYEAEEYLVVIVTGGDVVVVQLLYGLGLYVSEHEGVVAEKEIAHVAGDGAAEPIVDDIDGEAAFLAADDGVRKELAADLAVKPLEAAVADLETGAEALNVFDDFAIQEWDASLEGMSHGDFVAVH